MSKMPSHEQWRDASPEPFPASRRIDRLGAVLVLALSTIITAGAALLIWSPPPTFPLGFIAP